MVLFLFQPSSCACFHWTRHLRIRMAGSTSCEAAHHHILIIVCSRDPIMSSLLILSRVRFACGLLESGSAMGGGLVFSTVENDDSLTGIAFVHCRLRRQWSKLAVVHVSRVRHNTSIVRVWCYLAATSIDNRNDICMLQASAPMKWERTNAINDILTTCYKTEGK